MPRRSWSRSRSWRSGSARSSLTPAGTTGRSRFATASASSGLKAPAASTLARVFTRRGMVLAQPQKRPRTSYRRFQFATVHECWQLDAFQSTLADGSICAAYQVLDDRSRDSAGLPRHRRRDRTGRDHRHRQGDPAHQVPELLLTDNGAAFNQTRRGRSSQLVTHVRGCWAAGRSPDAPGTPRPRARTNGSTRPPSAGCAARPKPETEAGLLSLLEDFDQQYNNTRPHQSLRHATPAQVVAEGPHAVPPTPPNLQPPAPRHRCEPAAAVSASTARSASDTSRSSSASNTATRTVTVVVNGDHVSRSSIPAGFSSGPSPWNPDAPTTATDAPAAGTTRRRVSRLT